MNRNQMAQDVLDAQLLASYLARNGVQGVEKEIAAVARTDVPAEEPTRLPDDFYECYQKLAIKAAPVTVASLRDSTSKFKYVPIARAVNLLAMALTGIVLICLIVLGNLHSDWLTLSDLSSRLNNLPQPLTPASIKAIEQQIDTLLAELSDPGPETSGNFDSLITRLRKLETEQQQNKLLGPQRDELEKNLVAAADRAQNDLSVWKRLSKAVSLTQVKAETKAEKKEEASASTGRSAALSSLRIMSNLQKVVLPMFYGFLGATVFALRRIAKDSRHRLFRRESTVEHLVRPFLGAVAGFIIGWFMTPEKTGVIADATVAPFALAFVAGYSLEVLFTVLDRLTATEKPA